MKENEIRPYIDRLHAKADALSAAGKDEWVIYAQINDHLQDVEADREELYRDHIIWLVKRCEDLADSLVGLRHGVKYE